MRILVHDYSGHPFQAELSRALAATQPLDEVAHAYCSDYVSGKGNLEASQNDPKNLTFRPITSSASSDRYAFWGRVRHEVAYAISTLRLLREHRPDVVIYSNVPLLAHWMLTVLAPRTPTVFWHQDVYSAAMAKELEGRAGLVGRTLSRLPERMERQIAKHSRCVVAISEAFSPVYRRWHIEPRRITFIPNWAPIGELPTTRRSNAWSAKAGLSDRFVALYSGTLGLKHDPSVLKALANSLLAIPGACVVVISEGLGRDYLERELRSSHSTNLILLDYQDYSRLPEVLGAADVLLAVLEPDAGGYSVPSKILTYLCAGRPIVALVPADNQAAQTVVRAGAGFVVSDSEGFTAAVTALADDPELRAGQGARARLYAEEAFDIDQIVARWRAVLAAATGLPVLPNLDASGTMPS